MSSRTARSAELGSRWASRKCHWMTSFAVGEALPGSRCARPGMTPKAKRPLAAAFLSFDVIPAGPPFFRRHLGRRASCPCHHLERRAPSFLMSSRTARSAEPGSRRAPRKCHWMTSFAVGEALPGSHCAHQGMTARSKTSPPPARSSFRRHPHCHAPTLTIIPAAAKDLPLAPFPSRPRPACRARSRRPAGS